MCFEPHFEQTELFEFGLQNQKTLLHKYPNLKWGGADLCQSQKAILALL